LDEVDDLDPKTGHPAPLSTISDLVNAPRPAVHPAIAQRFSALTPTGLAAKKDVQRSNVPWERWRPNFLALQTYSMTSSARSKIDCGTVRPSDLAVLRFTTISNFVGN